MNTQNVYVILVILVATVFVGYLLYSDITNKNGSEKLSDSIDKQEKELIESTTNTAVLEETEESDTKNKEEESNLSQVTIPIPDLDRVIVIPETTHSSKKQEIIDRIHTLVGLLKENTQSYNEWIDLGALRKSIEDYEGARQAWEYASAIRPKNSVSFGNLGVLYGYYLQNPTLAEKNYLKAIENDPKLPYLYMQTADFYLEVLKDTKKAKNILEKGLIEVPGDEALKAALLNI